MMDAGMMRTAVPIDHIFARNQKVIKQMEETHILISIVMGLRLARRSAEATTFLKSKDTQEEKLI